VLKLALLLVGIALADSVNPSTVGPAVYLATVKRPVRRVGEFALAFFIINLAAGALIVIGPGDLIITLASRPGPLARHIVELVAGVVLIGVAIGLFLGRTRLAGLGDDRGADLRSGHAWALGATIALAELPTALPYFASLAAIIGSGFGLPRQLGLVLLFNVVFVAPLLAIMAAVEFGSENAVRKLRRAGDWLRRRWPLIFASVASIAGLALAGLALGWLLAR
jgi:cytochrome c biogenesis protein CcdA